MPCSAVSIQYPVRCHFTLKCDTQVKPNRDRKSITRLFTAGLHSRWAGKWRLPRLSPHAGATPLPLAGREFKETPDGNQRETGFETQKTAVSPDSLSQTWPGGRKPRRETSGLAQALIYLPASDRMGDNERRATCGGKSSGFRDQGVSVSAAGAPAVGTPDRAESSDKWDGAARIGYGGFIKCQDTASRRGKLHRENTPSVNDPGETGVRPLRRLAGSQKIIHPRPLGKE